MDNDLGAMLNGILQDPAQMERLRGMIAGLGGDAGATVSEERSEETAPAAVTEIAGNSAAMGDMLGGLLRDPTLMARLPGIISMLAPTAEGGKSDTRTGKRQTRADHRTALLLALRPYLSGGRREMVDSLINLGRLGDFLTAEQKEKT
ncbi:MAG: hypothetical protein IKL84_02090 [Clostridia bacterium]|nr:hypothetical protein [Clostridia bacterium]